MTEYQINQILQELEDIEDPETTGYVFIATADLFMSTIDYSIELEDIGSEYTIVGTNRITGAKAYMSVSAVRSVHQIIKPNNPVYKDDGTIDKRPINL